MGNRTLRPCYGVVSDEGLPFGVAAAAPPDAAAAPPTSTAAAAAPMFTWLTFQIIITEFYLFIQDTSSKDSVYLRI